MSWFSQSDFNEVEARYRAGLQAGLCFHLENEAQAEATVKEALPLAREEWEAKHRQSRCWPVSARKHGGDSLRILVWRKRRREKLRS